MVLRLWEKLESHTNLKDVEKAFISFDNLAQGLRLLAVQCREGRVTPSTAFHKLLDQGCPELFTGLYFDTSVEKDNALGITLRPLLAQPFSCS